MIYCYLNEVKKGKFKACTVHSFYSTDSAISYNAWLWVGKSKSITTHGREATVYNNFVAWKSYEKNSVPDSEQGKMSHFSL